MVRVDEIPQFEFIDRDVLYNKLPMEPFHIPAYYRLGIITFEQKFNKCLFTNIITFFWFIIQTDT